MYQVWQPSAPGKGHPHFLERDQWAGQAFKATGRVLETIRLNLAYSDGGGTVRVFLFHGRHAHEDLVESKIVQIRQNAATEVDFDGIRLAVGDRYVVQIFMHEHGAVYFSDKDEVPAGISYLWCPGSSAEACGHGQHDMNMEVVGWNR